MATTYTPLYTTTLGTAAASVTITMPSGYTDLILVAQPLKSTAGGGTIRYQVNSDTGSHYSNTTLYGDGSSAGSDRASNATYGRLGFWSGDNQGNNLIAHFQNYANTSTYKTILSRTNNIGSLEGAIVNLWRGSTGSSTEAITSLYIYNDGGNFAAGSTFSLYGVASTTALATVKATGGDSIVTSGGYTYHVFRSSGTFTPSQSLSADVLCIAGGGGGGYDRAPGGGAGGLSWQSGRSMSATGYTVTIGAGGAGGISYSPRSGYAGSNSVFDTITSNGGGQAGTTGGSGGGAYGQQNPAATGAAATQGNTGGATGYGNKGGDGQLGSGATGLASGGGGGAGAAGGNGVAGQSGAGGNGLSGATLSALNSFGAATLTGQLVSGNYYYAGGGGAGRANDDSPNPDVYGAGGYGGGGDGGKVAGANGSNGVAYTGGGGGGGSNQTQGSGGNGGSGIVIVRYAV